MKNINYISFRNRTGIYFFFLGYNDWVRVVYKKFSQPGEFFIIKSFGPSLAENFLNAAAETENLTSQDILIIAYQLNIPMPLKTALNLLDLTCLIKQMTNNLCPNFGPFFPPCDD